MVAQLLVARSRFPAHSDLDVTSQSSPAANALNSSPEWTHGWVHHWLQSVPHWGLSLHHFCQNSHWCLRNPSLCGDSESSAWPMALTPARAASLGEPHWSSTHQPSSVCHPSRDKEYPQEALTPPSGCSSQSLMRKVRTPHHAWSHLEFTKQTAVWKDPSPGTSWPPWRPVGLYPVPGIWESCLQLNPVCDHFYWNFQCTSLSRSLKPCLCHTTHYS